MFPPELGALYAENWKKNLADAAETAKKMEQWRVVVTIENPSTPAPCLQSAVYTFQLKSHETLEEAQAEFKSLGMSLPPNAKVKFEDYK